MKKTYGKIKKLRFGYICGICLLLALLVGFVVSPFFLFVHSHRWKYKIENFSEHQEDFLAVCQFTEAYFEKENTKSGVLVLGNNDVYGYPTLWCDGNDVSISSELKESLKQIRDSAFTDPDISFSCVRYQPERITFEPDTGGYALVYTKNGKRPTYAFSSKETKKPYVMKEAQNWYHVRCRD